MFGRTGSLFTDQAANTITPVPLDAGGFGLKVISVITKNFTGSLDIQGQQFGDGATAWNNTRYSTQVPGSGAPSAASEAQIAYVANTAYRLYLVRDPWPQLRLKVSGYVGGTISANYYLTDNDATASDISNISVTPDFGVAITGQALEADGSGNLGWLSSVRKAITDGFAQLFGLGLYTSVAHTKVAMGITAGTVLLLNASRKYAVIQNDDPAAIVYITLDGSTPTYGGAGIRLNPGGGSYEICKANGNLTTAAIKGITNGPTKYLLVTEAT